MTWTNRRTQKEDVSLMKQRLLSAVPAVIATAAYFSSFAGNYFCNNIQFVPQGEFNPDDPLRPRTIAFGIWKHKELRIDTHYGGDITFAEYCSGYPENTEFDAKWRIARAFACLNMIFSGFLLLWQWFAPFLLFDALYWRWAMFLFAAIGGCQLATLLFLYSDACYDNVLLEDMVSDPSIYPTECTWDSGAVVQIVAAILYFCTSISLCLIPAPGIRPNERKFPMMVWDHAASETGDEGEEGESRSPVFSDSDDDDDDSVESFACDYNEDYVPSASHKKPHQIEDLTETEVSQTEYDDVDLTVKEVPMNHFARVSV